MAFVNTALMLTAEGFIKLPLPTEVSQSGKPELLARIRDAGVEWSLEYPDLDHASITVLKEILEGLGAKICFTPVSSTGNQEHFIRFNCGHYFFSQIKNAKSQLAVCCRTVIG